MVIHQVSFVSQDHRLSIDMQTGNVQDHVTFVGSVYVRSVLQVETWNCAYGDHWKDETEEENDHVL